MPGVTNTVVGYTGGKAPSPTYESVCRGDGHTEAIQVQYDTSKVTYEELLSRFFKDSPADSRGKPQYKSAIWIHNEEQKEIAMQAAKKAGKASILEIEEAPEFHPAEEYHQKYFEKKGCAQS